MPISIEKTPIEGLLLIHPQVHVDDRGYFLETYNRKAYEELGVKISFVQDNQSFSKKNTLRGLHYQRLRPQGKLVRVISGEVFDVAVDLRKHSPTYGKWFGIVLNAIKKTQMYIPPEFAHGFLVLSDMAVFSYKCSDFYDPTDESGIVWNDPKIGIKWPINGQNPIISNKDQELPRFGLNP